MSRKTIGHVGPQLVEETSVSFDRRADGYYQKRTDTISRDLKTGKITSVEKNIADSLYEVTQDDMFDDQMSYHDENGNLAYIRFKKAAIED